LFGKVIRLIWKIIIAPHLFLRELRIKERRISCGGENADKTFYIIGWGKSWGSSGLMWLVYVNFAHIVYAVKRGYVPIIDLQNYNNQYLAKCMLHKENSWEYYFEQPMGYTLKDIRKSKNIILSQKEGYPEGCALDCADAAGLPYYRNIFKKYVKFNPATAKYLEAEYSSILKGKGRVLGVLCRGTDYTLKKISKHFIQPQVLEVIQKAKQVMTEKQCAYVYLATEDQHHYETFKNHFGDKLLTNRQTRFSEQDLRNVKYLSQINSGKEREKYFLGLEYLSSLHLLSKCVCFIGGLTAGTPGVYMMSEGFEYAYTWELGRYPDTSFRGRIKKMLKIT
jgi:hypothetical protein